MLVSLVSCVPPVIDASTTLSLADGVRSATATTMPNRAMPTQDDVTSAYTTQLALHVESAYRATMAMLFLGSPTTAAHVPALSARIPATLPRSATLCSHQLEKVTTFAPIALPIMRGTSARGVQMGTLATQPCLAKGASHASVARMQTLQCLDTVTIVLAVACVAVETQVDGTALNAWKDTSEIQLLGTAGPVNAVWSAPWVSSATKPLENVLVSQVSLAGHAIGVRMALELWNAAASHAVVTPGVPSRTGVTPSRERVHAVRVCLVPFATPASRATMGSAEMAASGVAVIPMARWTPTATNGLDSVPASLEWLVELVTVVSLAFGTWLLLRAVSRATAMLQDR